MTYCVQVIDKEALSTFREGIDITLSVQDNDPISYEVR